MKELILKFDTEQLRKAFIGWYLDGGGEQEFGMTGNDFDTSYNFDKDNPDITQGISMKDEITIIIEGGCLQSVHGYSNEYDIQLIDIDNLKIEYSNSQIDEIIKNKIKNKKQIY